MNERFARSEALLGSETMKRLAAARVLLVGVGGVGSWCAEALVRTGLGGIALVDDDLVSESNVNRQCPATVATIGRRKVEVMAERLKAINPDCEVIGRFERFEGFESFKGFERFDLVIDAIDSVDCKARLILGCFAAEVPVISSMGAALRTDPMKVQVSRFDKVQGDGLAKALRNRFRKLETWPGRFMCVWSAEPPLQAAERGSIMPVTATFGMCLASEALRELCACERCGFTKA